VREGKQRIVFIDPHGLQHEGPGSEKIEFAERIKDVEKRLGDPSVILESVILGPPKSSRSEIKSRWKIDDAELNARHVLFMADAGYMESLMNLVRR
jgi:hypothetical protein